MFTNTGFIKLHRQIINWGWFQDITTCHFFIYSLLKANHSKTNWQDIIINEGSFVSSLQHMAVESGLSLQQIRTAMKKLEKSRELKIKSSSKFTIVEILNWEKYQNSQKITQLQSNRDISFSPTPNKQITNNQQTNNKRATNEQQTNNKQITTNKNEKNEKNEKNSFLYSSNLQNCENDKGVNPGFAEDPFYSPQVISFLNTFKEKCKVRTTPSPDDRVKILKILNDLKYVQKLDVDEEIQTLCDNFNKIDFSGLSSFKPTLHWALDNFYAILDGQYNKNISKQDVYIQAAKERGLDEYGN